MSKSGCHRVVSSRAIGAILASVISLAAVLDGSASAGPLERNERPSHAGSLDPSFGDGGIVSTDAGKGEAVRSVLATEDGIVVATGIRHGSALVRYLPDGSLDAGFGTGGIVTELADADFVDLLGGTNDSLLVLGRTFIERRSPSGAFDGSFGVGGRSDFGPDNYGSSMAVLPDGGIVVAGTAFSPTGASDLLIVKFTPGGSFDPAFGDGGGVRIDLGTLNDRGLGIAVLPDGRILVLASRTSWPGDECCRNSTSLVRLDPDGSVDGTFGEDGIATWRLTTHNGEGWEPLAMRLMGNGDVIALMGQGGTYGCPTTGGGNAYVVRLHGDGTIDRGFGRRGHVSVPLIDPFTENIALQDDRGILVGGEACDSGGDVTTFGMVRLTGTGTLDRRFGVDGLVSTPLGLRGSLVTTITLQPDGKIVLAGMIMGRAYGFTGSEVAVARYLATDVS